MQSDDVRSDSYKMKTPNGQQALAYLNHLRKGSRTSDWDPAESLEFQIRALDNSARRWEKDNKDQVEYNREVKEAYKAAADTAKEMAQKAISSMEDRVMGRGFMLVISFVINFILALMLLAPRLS